MAKAKDEFENVKVRRSILQPVRKIKKNTGISILAFVEKAIAEKVEAHKKEETKTT